MVGPPYYDVDNNVVINIIDLLNVVNYLTTQPSPEGEGEAASVDAVFHELGKSLAPPQESSAAMLFSTEMIRGRRKRAR